MGLSVRYYESPRVHEVCRQVIGELHQRVSLEEVGGADGSELEVFFCPIVSRAGTDIAAVLLRVKADKPTIVILLQHTFEREAVVISGSEYEREGLIFITFLFSEDQGLLRSQKNNEAFTKATQYLQMLARKKKNKEGKGRSRNMILSLMSSKYFWGIVAIAGVAGIIIVRSGRWRLCQPLYQHRLFYSLKFKCKKH